MTNPLPSTNYTIVSGVGGEQYASWFGLINFPMVGRSTTAFSMSLAAGPVGVHEES